MGFADSRDRAAGKARFYMEPRREDSSEDRGSPDTQVADRIRKFECATTRNPAPFCKGGDQTRKRLRVVVKA